MKNLMKAIAAIMLMLAVVITAGCKKEDNPNSGGENNSEIINPKYVPIDWDNATLLSANDSIGDYQIQFNGEMPELQPGSIITIDQDTVVHHIFIETLEANGNTVSVTSTEAYLTDIFADTDFTLATNENSKLRSQGKVYFPTGIYQRGDDGTFQRLEMKSSREDGWGFTHDLWQIAGDFDGQVIHSSDNHSIYMEKLNYNVDIDLEMYFNFSGRDVHEIVGNALDRYRSEALNVNAYLLGSFDTEQRLRCDIRGNCSYNPGYDIWKHNLFRPLRVRFVVLGVPVIITLNSDLYRQVQVNANGEISTYMGFVDNANGRLGFEWHQSGGMEPVNSFTNTFELTPPTVEGKGSIVGKVWAFPRIRLLLYDLIGPSFDIKPYLSTTLSGGFKEEMLGQSNDFCAWSLDCNTGLDACCGLSLQFMGYEVENYSTQDKNIIDQPLYHSPLWIEHNAKGSGMKIGQRNEVSFTVYDRNHLFNTDVVTPLPQFVKFEGDGDISSEYGIAHGGTVSVDWTPLHDSDVLYARLYDIDGNVISEAEVGAGITVTTLSVTNIGKTTATGGGEITANEYITVEERGLCWSTAGAPTIGDSHANSGTGTGNYTVNMTGLTAGTTYYARAYAYFGGEFYYGNEVSFTTQEPEDDWVDLGLPSGLLWATRNVGASSPEDYGDYYAWGETSPKNIYNWETYLYCGFYGWIGWIWRAKMTKYCDNPDYGYNGFTDNLTTLLPEDDAATVNYGGRMPTWEEYQELIDYCTSSFLTTQNGVNGIRFTGSNGNSLFLPQAGYRVDDELYSAVGDYWSSSLCTGDPTCARYFDIDHHGSVHVFNGFSSGRRSGLSVRAVRSAPQN